MTTHTPPEAVEAALKYAEVRHLMRGLGTFDEYLKHRKEFEPYFDVCDGVDSSAACIRILAARVRELEQEQQPDQAKQDDEVLYGLEDDEFLEDDVDEVVRRVVADNIDSPECIEWPVKVLEFRRMKVSESHKKSLSKSVLDSVLESLDEDYADENGDYTKPTDPMQLAARKFVDEVVRHYTVWNCEPTGEVVEVTRERAKEIVG